MQIPQTEHRTSEQWINVTRYSSHLFYQHVWLKGEVCSSLNLQPQSPQRKSMVLCSSLGQTSRVSYCYCDVMINMKQEWIEKSREDQCTTTDSAKGNVYEEMSSSQCEGRLNCSPATLLKTPTGISESVVLETHRNQSPWEKKINDFVSKPWLHQAVCSREN